MAPTRVENRKMWSGHLQPDHELWSRPHLESVTPPLLRFFLVAHPGAPTVDPFSPDSLFRLWIEDHTKNCPKAQAN